MTNKRTYQRYSAEFKREAERQLADFIRLPHAMHPTRLNRAETY
ncbi:hypothetical protein [Pseudomonas sp. LTJR-52]|nr:hypothetical protein [Pseudomonas sp. LTJR-52]